MIGCLGTSRAYLVVLCLVFLWSRSISALRTTSGSPCAGVCGTTTNTTSDEISCLDRSYNETTTGKFFEKCNSCLLKSDFYDASTGESDVDWGLYNLRYTVSTCVFGFPNSVSNVSSPCPVTCDAVRPAVIFDVADPTVSNLDAWCDTPRFADNVVNDCEFCYNLTTTQVYLANFLESIRYNCHFKATTGKKFRIEPTRIFTQSLLPSSLSLATPGSSSANLNLGVVIAVPIVGFLLILCSLAICCFFFIRHRRRKARRTRQKGHHMYDWNNPANGQQAWSEHQHAANGQNYGLGMGFMDNDGRAQEIAYNYGPGSDQQYEQQYQQHFQGQDKPGFSNHVTEQPPSQSPVHSQILDPDQKRPVPWQ